MIARRATHKHDVLNVLAVFGVQELMDLIVDDASIGVIDRTMSTDQQLGRLVRVDIAFAQLAEARIRVDHIRDTLGRVETGNLHNVVTSGPGKFGHLVAHAQAAEFTHVELRVPSIELLVEPIKPDRLHEINSDTLLI